MKFKLLTTLGLVAVFLIAGCGKEKEDDSGSDTSNDSAETNQGDEQSGVGHHGASVDLGEATLDDWTFKATRNEMDLTKGGELAVDLSVTGDPAKISALRLWVGTESADGSIKALASLDNQSVHAHVELPNPLPDGSKLWVEVEVEDGTKKSTSIDLKM